MRSDMIQVDGLDFHCLAEGPEDAPMLLLLHGFPEYSGAWAEMMPLLSDRYFCVAPDQRGYGRSARPKGVENYTGGKLARDAAGIIGHYRPGGQAHVFGHDWGAGVAYALAMRAPALVARLVIANGVHPIPFQRALAKAGAQAEASQYINWLRRPDSHEKLAENGCEKLAGMFAAKMNMSWMTPAKRAEYVAAWGGARGIEGMVNWYRASPVAVPAPGEPLGPEDLPPMDPAKMRISMPHLLVWGLGDTALLPEVRDGLGDLCDAGLEVAEIPGADHWLLHQQPEAVAERVRAFLG